MRILHVFDHSIPLHSGYSFRSLAILREQRALGWETFQVTGAKHRAADAEEEIDGWRFHRTAPGRAPWARWPVLNQWDVVTGLRRRIVELARLVRPDLLHAHSPCLDGLAALGAGRRLALPVVYELRASWEDAAVDHGRCREGDLRYRASRALESWVLRRADQITTICEGLRSDILSRGIPSRRVTVVPNGVDPLQFSAEGIPDPALRAELGLARCDVLGFIGSFYEYEGLHLLIGALPAILARRPTIRLLLVGGGFEEQRLRALVRATGVGPSVVFAGRVPHDRVQRYYDLVDVFVYPRLSMRLTELVTPLKPLEALARRRLVVASDVGGHRELIRNGETGYLFRTGDAADLAATVLRLLDAEGEWPRLREAGRRLVETERNWKASVARYREVYAALLGK